MTMIDPQMYRMDADGKPQRSYLRASALEIIDSLDLTNGGFNLRLAVLESSSPGAP
jgi:hypothetical protein